LLDEAPSAGKNETAFGMTTVFRFMTCHFGRSHAVNEIRVSSLGKKVFPRKFHNLFKEA